MTSDIHTTETTEMPMESAFADLDSGNKRVTMSILQNA